jgi:hypothetical protein
VEGGGLLKDVEIGHGASRQDHYTRIEREREREREREHEGLRGVADLWLRSFASLRMTTARACIC